MDEVQHVVRSRLLAYGASAGEVQRVLEHSIFASVPPRDEDGAEEEPVRRLYVWRGMTGQKLTEVLCKPQTTARQVKHEIFSKTGIPIAQQQLFGFGSSILIEDDQLVDTVPDLEGCGGLQIIVDFPGEGPVLSGSWGDGDEEEDQQELYEKKASSSDSLEEDDHSSRTRKDSHSGRQPHGRGRGKGHGKGGGSYPSPYWAQGAGWAGEGGSKGAGKGRAAGSGCGARRGHEVGPKMQHHFILPRYMQEAAFDVLSRTKSGTKAIWQATGVSLRLHGPGSGQQENEQDLMLSVSAKQSDCDYSAFLQAVQMADDLLWSLGDQYRRFCRRSNRHVPEPEALAVRSERGYRKGSHKIRLAE